MRDNERAYGVVAPKVSTKSVCNVTTHWLKAGGIYRLTLTIDEPWKDNTTPATPSGIVLNEAPWYMPFAVPIRRHLGQPWFATMAKIDARGSDTYALEWPRMDREAGTVAEGAGPGQRWEAILTARSSGRLYLYVNDAYPYPFASPFYPNNQGTAGLSLENVPGSR